MNKIYRKEADLGVAFSRLKKAEESLSDQNDSAEDSNSGEQPSGVLISAQGNSLGARHRAKFLLRRVAAALYGLLKPFIRPIAFRVRAFLLGGIQQYMSTELDAKLDQQTLHLLAVKEEMRQLRAELQKRSMEASSVVIQELQFTRELLEEDLHEMYAKFEAKLARMEPPLGSELASDLKTQLNRIELYAYSGARRFAVNCGGGDVLVRTEAGYILCQGSDPAILSMLVERGDLERGTRLLIERLLKPGSFFIDVGANLGVHTMAAANAMQGKGRIIAFEPFPDTARLLGLSVFMNGFASVVEIHQAAISTGSGKAALYLGRVSGHHSLFLHALEAGHESKHIEVPLARIDDVVGEDELVSLIKIDAEGAELEVLKTAEKTIRRNRDIAIIAEFGPSHLKIVGHTAEDWLAAFTSEGMDWRLINADTGALESCSLEELKGVHSANLFFARYGSPLLST